ncbi:MAG: hypothetical protein LBS17_05780 [Actinomycetes bacterium]|jgi:hypothetical protein|nr:hypothetical protein [Actinomycetes bacterium]
MGSIIPLEEQERQLVGFETSVDSPTQIIYNGDALSAGIREVLNYMIALCVQLSTADDVNDIRYYRFRATGLGMSYPVPVAFVHSGTTI